MFYERIRDGYKVVTDLQSHNLDVIHGYLSRSYWASGVPRDLVEKAIKHSLCFSLYKNEEQIGFGRVITDYTSIGYLADVFILEGYQGRGLGKFLVQSILDHPELQTLRRFILVTADAHELYRKFGFDSPEKPEMYMDMCPARTW
ncbi:MAG: GNAT family N-acetyltransferase [Calditrichia bacterium]